MKDFRYIDNVATLELDIDKCIGCGMCETVCPHRVFKINDRKATMVDRNACMECGACANNCPTEAIGVSPGVGCATYIIAVWLHQLTGGRFDSSGCC